MNFSRSNILIPISVPLFDATGSPRTAAAETATIRIMSRDTGYLLDPADNTFKETVEAPGHSVTTFPNRPNDYYRAFDASAWPRGHYVAIITDGDEVYDVAFSVGLYADRRLALATTYDGETLRTLAWIEENGIVQTDTAGLTDISIIGPDRTVIAGAEDVTTSTDGILAFNTDVELSVATTYALRVAAQIPTAAGVLEVTLMEGMARP